MPQLRGPIPVTDTSYPFSTMVKAVVPFDVADHGYVEEEYFQIGTAHVYDDLDGGLATLGDPVAYATRLLVRRPADPQSASGVVWIDILNASNGWDLEDHWRRAWDHWMERGHAYIGITSKPINVDALKNFDPGRYRELTFDTVPGREPVRATEGVPFDPFQIIAGAEEGLIWDMLTQLGVLLRNEQGAAALVGVTPRLVMLSGHSQSSIVLNTYLQHFHAPVREEHGKPLFDGYFCSVGSTIQRPLRQPEENTGPAFMTIWAEAPDVDVPTITITSEADLTLFKDLGHDALATPGLADGPLRRHYCVAGSNHGNWLSPVAPQPGEIVKAGRVPRVIPAELLAVMNPFPLEATMIAAMDALERWVDDGVPAPESVFFDADENNQAIRDEDGNIRWGVRYGILAHPLGVFDGNAMTFTPFSQERVLDEFPDLATYLETTDAWDDALMAQGYLNARGKVMLQMAATELWNRVFA